MAEQLSLPGLAAAPKVQERAGRRGRPKPADRLFFAVFPDDPAAACIAQLTRRLQGAHGLTGKPLPAARLHVTLHWLGDYPTLREAPIALARDVASSIAVPAFDVRFDRALSFRGRAAVRPLVLCGGSGVAALAAFQRVLDTAMTQAGLGGGARRPFTPHVTLLYDDRAVPEHAVEAIGWTVRGFALVHSLVGESRHVRLSSWPLRG